MRLFFCVFLLLVAGSLCAQTSNPPASPSAPEPAELPVEPVKTSITVRGKLESPVSAYVTDYNEQSLASRPGVNVDDRLRDVPGFTLFRRSSSLAAHPTTQGISLRGIGSSAAGRTLVVYDGLPVNDPFGGWVYWTRVNPDTVSSAEIARGASSSVYGDRAMGGTVSLLTPTPSARHAFASAEGGEAGIVDARGGYSDLFGKFGLSSSVRGFRSRGYFIVPEEYRGPVDSRADVDFLVGDLRFDLFRDKDRLILRGNVLGEQRQNGTDLRYNSSTVGTAGAHYQRDNLSISGYHSWGTLRSTFSAVNDDRDSERQTLLQKVSSNDTGGSLVWNRSSNDWNLMLGADTHRVSGTSRDTVVATGFQRRPGGTLWQQGLFAQGDFNLGRRTQLYAGLRHDFVDRGNNFWSPRGGIAHSEGPRRWRASIYRGFRAPTLNELFRQFRVGNITTLNNPGLTPETMISVDGGMDWRHRSVLFRTTLFWQSIDDLIGNATIRLDPTPLRQRQNFGSATGRGVELELQKSFGRIRADAAYLYVDSQLDNTNVWMPQVPRHQGSFQLLYASGRTLLSAGVRSYAKQFEDDLNIFLLPGFATVQILASTFSCCPVLRPFRSSPSGDSWKASQP
jgi:outer membrane cobalamin receptor